MNRPVYRTLKRLSSFRTFLEFISILFNAVFLPGASAQNSRSAPSQIPIPYLSTRTQAGHEIVKTEQFVVPVGTTIEISGLEFELGMAKLTPKHERIVQQIFNSIEEITENTVLDADQSRVADFAKMEFEIRGLPEYAGNIERNSAISTKRAQAVMNFLTNLGTPAWRLKAKGMGIADILPPKKKGKVVFVRTR